jgi:hypothetical protein
MNLRSAGYLVVSIALHLAAFGGVPVREATRQEDGSEAGWKSLLQMPIPDLQAALASPEQEPLRSTLKRLQDTVQKLDPRHRKLPLFMSPSITELPVKPWTHNVRNIPVFELIKSLNAIINVKCRFIFTDAGILCLSEEEVGVLEE